jgi:hypothetical protein
LIGFERVAVSRLTTDRPRTGHLGTHCQNVTRRAQGETGRRIGRRATAESWIRVDPAPLSEPYCVGVVFARAVLPSPCDHHKFVRPVDQFCSNIFNQCLKVATLADNPG